MRLSPVVLMLLALTLGAKAAPQQGACGDQETVLHANGGGKVATTATVDASVFVSRDSAVCGRAIVTGPVRLVNGSVVNGRAAVSGRSTLDGSVVNGQARVLNASITESTLNDAQITDSRVSDSTINGRANVQRSTVNDSVVNGNTAIIDRKLDGLVLND